MEDAPWHLMGKLFIVKEWDQSQSVDEIDLDTKAFWIQVHNLSQDFMSLENIPLISKHLGKLLSFEKAIVNGVLIRPFLRLRILVSLGVPLKLGFWLNKPSGERCWIKFKYERLQHFCFNCGILGHEQKECSQPRIWSSDTLEYKRYNASLGVAPARPLSA